MQLVRFLKAYEYRATQYTTIGYPAGMEIECDDDCADHAVAIGAAELIGGQVEANDPDPVEVEAATEGDGE